jgi:hypothetical protein
LPTKQAQNRSIPSLFEVIDAARLTSLQRNETLVMSSRKNFRHIHLCAHTSASTSSQLCNSRRWFFLCVVLVEFRLSALVSDVKSVVIGAGTIESPGSASIRSRIWVITREMEPFDISGGLSEIRELWAIPRSTAISHVASLKIQRRSFSHFHSLLAQQARECYYW